jgi:hypothetical protein
MSKIGLSLASMALFGMLAASTLSAQAQSGEVRVKAKMASGAASGQADYRERGSRRRLNVQAEDLPSTTGSPQPVFVNGSQVGTMALTACPLPAMQLLCGEMELNTQDGQQVPVITRGQIVSIGSPALLAGALN